jgi:AraC-like DNA-binding protein
MNQNLLSLSHGDLHWTDALPPAFKAVRLPGSTIATSIGEFGSICIQEFNTENFSIHFKVFDLLQHFVARSFLQRPGLFAKLVVKGRIDIDTNKPPAIPLRQNQFILSADQTFIHEELYQNKTHITLDTFLSDSLAKEIQQLFPGTNKNSPVSWAGSETLQLVHSILGCKYEKELRRHFFESRVKDLFFKYLFIIQNNTSPGLPITDEELAAVYKAEQLINDDITRHYPIPELSKKVLLNEFRLKLLFKKIFGTGPYEYLMIKRLEKGKELLEAGLSVKEVAAQVGYRPSDFTTSFRNHFGYPPGVIKKRNS